ncbi:MAG: lipoprotein signal peptidase [Gammaproteobacteria bacterium]|nr:lipoprotein signal peptidase [Gammaproteobacteria bacterium]NIR85848.1 lipoprotein signal peptidase [Gammaproteobacteria bacterium]NIR90604.1 lipoprotein signal peptidase [Gammaproteobacteria bacterium]NIU06983.1 lipoprotein signal peptidase [Gammaproteobacteria bacterium]NIV75896.1 lipoprotein signal peptidase [Gammaproteobacteria bacterium]
MRRHTWLWLGLALVVIALDQGTKVLATSTLSVHDPLAVTPFLNFTLTHNTGAAFSFLSDAGGWQRWFFSALSLAVSAFIVVWLRKLPPDKRWLGCALALVLGGALGNLWDRLARGAVVDFIDVYYRSWHWPAFNVADSAISVGVVILLISILREETPSTAREEEP